MKNLALIIILTLTLTASCKKNEIVKGLEKQTIKATTSLPYSGTWTRSFAMGKDVTATVNYKIYQDSIQYEMLGPMNMKYTLTKDTLVQDNRWIGKRNNMPYVIFVKNISKDSITLLKMKVESKEKALTMTFPSDTARSKFSSWNTFKKK